MHPCGARPTYDRTLSDFWSLIPQRAGKFALSMATSRTCNGQRDMFIHAARLASAAYRTQEASPTPLPLAPRYAAPSPSRYRRARASFLIFPSQQTVLAAGKYAHPGMFGTLAFSRSVTPCFRMCIVSASRLTVRQIEGRLGARRAPLYQA